jgi:hypothetical protein
VVPLQGQKNVMHLRACSEFPYAQLFRLLFLSILEEAYVVGIFLKVEVPLLLDGIALPTREVRGNERLVLTKGYL